MKIIPPYFGCSLLVLLMNCAFAETVKNADQAWKNASMGFIKDASADFTELAKEQPSNREAKYGMAVTLLDLQPKTRSTIDEASRYLEAVIAGGGDDELGISARYLSGRLEQIHRFEPNPILAEKIYDNLYLGHPEHALAQLGFAKSTLLKLFQTDYASEREATLRAAELAGAKLSNADARRAFHIVMARAYEKFTTKTEARLQHLFAIEQIQPVRRENLANLLITIAEVARKSGSKELAANYYQKFLSTFDRDSRRYLAEQRLAELQGLPSLLSRP